MYEQFRILLHGWRLGQLTSEQKEQFARFVRSGQFDELIGDAMETDLALGWLQGASRPSEQEEDLGWIKNKMQVRETSPVHRVHLLHTAWFRVAVAILLLAGIGAYLWIQPLTDKAAITQTKPNPGKNDVLPGGSKAILKLADGSRIVLDSAANGLLARQSGANIAKTGDGQIIYSFNKGSLSSTVSYNTMSTPRGGQYQLALPDGSKVWLNAESSITFPTAFIENTRSVNITGEVYFEIKKNPSQPFIVKTPNEDITVLGTSFNVNAYIEEPAMKTSLVEGSVKVGKTIVKPGQAYLNGNIIATDLEQDVAWKNGAFNFRNIGIEAAFRQLGRWYNVDVRFAGAVPNKKLGGKMGRDLTLLQVLTALEDIGINTRLEGHTLVVLPE